MFIGSSLASARQGRSLSIVGSSQLSYTSPIWLSNAQLEEEDAWMMLSMSITLIDALIDREGGYVDHPADKGGPTCFGITEAVARAHGYAGPMRQLPRDEAAAIYRRLYWLRPRFDEVAKRSARIAARAVRHRRQHGAGGRRDLPPARADRAQPQRRGLSRPDARRPRSARRTLAALDAFLALRGTGAAAKPSCCARSRRSRASATCASPSAAPPMRLSSTAGSRTGSVID